MSNGPSTDEENDLIVADYFAMLAEDMAGRPYNKAQHRRSLMPLLRSRTEGSIEFKHQNISAVLKGLGEDWILGYKPAFNFQMTLVDAVARWLAWNPAWLGRMPGSRSANGLREAAQIWIGPSPTLSNQPPPLELEQMLHVAKKFDVAGRDERNRALGRAGEERVVAHEQSALKIAGRDDLARKVRWVAVFVDQYPAQPISSRTALAVSKLNQAALPGEDLYRKLAAVFTRHHPLDGFQQVGADAAIVFELLAAIVDADPSTGADMLVVGTFICILKPAPAADVIDQNDVEICHAQLDIRDQFLQGGAAADRKAAFAIVRIGLHDLDAALVGIFADLVGLVVG